MLQRVNGNIKPNVRVEQLTYPDLKIIRKPNFGLNHSFVNLETLFTI